VKVWRLFRNALGASFFSPAGLLVRAALIAVAYFVLSMAHVQECTSALSFSFPDGVPRALVAVGCAVYLFFHFAWVLLVPTLVVAAALLAVVSRAGRGARGERLSARTG
jgi:hypothetical protein